MKSQLSTSYLSFKFFKLMFLAESGLGCGVGILCCGVRAFLVEVCGLSSCSARLSSPDSVVTLRTGLCLDSAPAQQQANYCLSWVLSLVGWQRCQTQTRHESNQ